MVTVEGRQATEHERKGRAQLHDANLSTCSPHVGGCGSGCGRGCGCECGGKREVNNMTN